jgi:hypothetical protein
MTTQQQLDKLTHIAAVALDSIQALERITARHDAQIEKILGAQQRTDLSVRALADEIINTQREWQGYLRRIPPQ